MEYILDINSPKIQKAMKALSITNEELRVKSPNSFLRPGIPEHIQQLRYTHYTAKSTSLANRVINFLKKPALSTTPKTSALCQYKSTFRDTQNEKFKKNYQKALLSFYEFEKKTRKSEAQVLRKVDRDGTVGNRLKEFVKGRRDKLESKFMRNKQNLRQIEMEREKKTEEMIDRINRRGKSQSVCHSREKSVRMRPSSQVEDDIDNKLQQINKKMIRSSENYQKMIKEKAQRVKIQKIRQRGKSLSDNYEELVISIASKHESAESRREKLKQKLQANAHSREFRFVDKIKLIQSQETESKMRNLREKEKKTEDFLLRVKLRQRHEIEYKHEKHKLFEQCVNENVLRQKKMLNMKKEQIIEKHLELNERQKEQAEFLERANRRTREKAMNFTLKKEKMNVLRSRISKSQTPEKINKFLNTI